MSNQAQTFPIKPAGEAPTVLAPDADLFQRRARRFEQLADGHSLGDWLRFLAVLSRLQQEALQSFPAVPLPELAALTRSREHRMPPLPAQAWPRDPAWRAALRRIATALMPAAPDAGRADLARLATLPDEQLEALAERVLHTELYGDDAALLPYVGAALQVYWTALAQRSAPIAPLDVPGVCPCCGFLPVASVVKTVGETANLRYLHCALCNTEWNLVRVKCASCDSTAGIAYRELAGEAVRNPGAVRAETCDECKSYLKIVYQEKGGFDPIADDLATLALDILVDEAGYARAGPNLLLVPGG
jgi:FdhE protein